MYVSTVASAHDGYAGCWGDRLDLWLSPGLLSWASGRNITREQAEGCARRDPGRSWEAIPLELDKLGAALSSLINQSNCCCLEACSKCKFSHAITKYLHCCSCTCELANEYSIKWQGCRLIQTSPQRVLTTVAGVVPEAWELPLDLAKQKALWKPHRLNDHALGRSAKRSAASQDLGLQVLFGCRCIPCAPPLASTLVAAFHGLRVQSTLVPDLLSLLGVKQSNFHVNSTAPHHTFVAEAMYSERDWSQRWALHSQESVSFGPRPRDVFSKHKPV